MRLQLSITVRSDVTVPFTYLCIGEKFCYTSVYSAYRRSNEHFSHFYQFSILTKISEDTFITHSGTVLHIGVNKNDKFFHPVLVAFENEAQHPRPRPDDAVLGDSK